MTTLLTISGWIFTAVFACLILVPWWFGRRHLISFWTIFLAGSINFLTMGMVQNASGLENSLVLRATPKFLLAMALFYGIASAIYLFPMKKRAAAGWPRWPVDSPQVLGAACLLLSAGSILAGFAPYFPGVQLLFVVNGPASIAAFCLGLIMLVRKPGSPFSWGLVTLGFMTALFNSLTFGTGRRELLGVFLVLPVVGYWLVLRTRSKSGSLLALFVLGFAAIIVVTAYASFRHADREADSAASRAITRIQKMPEAIYNRLTDFRVFGEVGAVFDGQNAVMVSLLTIDLIDSGELEQKPLHTLGYVVSNPIPRSFWRDKPIGLGKILPVLRGNDRVTWGPSVIGHSFFDGGWPVLILYASMLGFGIRYLDLRMLQDPLNPWQLAVFSSVSGHVLGFARGDCGTFMINIVGPIIVLSLILHVFRNFTGEGPGVVAHAPAVAAA